MEGHCPYYGEKSPMERDILKEIIFQRQLKAGQTKRKSFQKIADDLNCRGLWPRRAKKWTAVLVQRCIRDNGGKIK